VGIAKAEIQEQVEALYINHHGWLVGWLRRKLEDSYLAADVAQDTFVRILTTRHIEAPRESRAFLTHIAKGLLIDHWRRSDVERAYLEAIAHLPEPQAPSPEERIIVIEALMAVETMLASLKPLTRRLFLMAQLEGLTLAQIAEQSGKPLITVRRHIQRALVACMSVRG
jgi:RNA polymerase sigma factor (sigma-70 family)